MEYKEISLGLSANMVTGENWLKCSFKADLLPGEDVFAASEKIKADIEKIIKTPPTLEEMKGIQIKPAHSDEDMQQLFLLIKDLNESKDIKTLTVVHNEAPDWVRANNNFIDAVLVNKLRITKIK